MTKASFPAFDPYPALPLRRRRRLIRILPFCFHSRWDICFSMVYTDDPARRQFFP
jgi:hypothetical protein